MNYFPEIWGWTAAVVSTVSAGTSGYYAWRAHARKRPICEVTVAADTPWAGWSSIRIEITNPAPARVAINRISIPLYERGRLVDPADLKTPRDTTIRNDWLHIVRTSTENVFPDHPPEIAGARSLQLDPGIPVEANAAKRQTITVLAPPGKNGVSGLPGCFAITFRWFDKRNSPKSVKAKT